MLDYLNQTLGLNAKVKPWPNTDKLPLYLRSGKKYYLLQIGGVESLLIEVDENNFNLPAFLKQMAKLPTQPEHIVLCFKHLDSRKRKALIEAGMPFIVPKSMLYMPFIGIALKEQMKFARPGPNKLSATAQLILLHLVYQRGRDRPTRKVDLANLLNTSAMNVTRGVQELEALKLVDVKKAGRSDYVSSIDSGKSLYEKALPHMIDPVQKHIYVQNRAEFASLPLAGESALAQRSMLASPEVACRAISRKEYKQLEDVEEVDPAWSIDRGYIQLELWKYDPKVLADSAGVDVISLSLSLRKNGDERVEQAVEEMMEEYKW